MKTNYERIVDLIRNNIDVIGIDDSFTMYPSVDEYEDEDGDFHIRCATDNYDFNITEAKANAGTIVGNRLVYDDAGEEKTLAFCSLHKIFP